MPKFDEILSEPTAPAPIRQQGFSAPATASTSEAIAAGVGSLADLASAGLSFMQEQKNKEVTDAVIKAHSANQAATEQGNQNSLAQEANRSKINRDLQKQFPNDLALIESATHQLFTGNSLIAQNARKADAAASIITQDIATGFAIGDSTMTNEEAEALGRGHRIKIAQSKIEVENIERQIQRNQLDEVGKQNAFTAISDIIIDQVLVPANRIPELASNAVAAGPEAEANFMATLAPLTNQAVTTYITQSRQTVAYRALTGKAREQADKEIEKNATMVRDMFDASKGVLAVKASGEAMKHFSTKLGLNASESIRMSSFIKDVLGERAFAQFVTSELLSNVATVDEFRTRIGSALQDLGSLSPTEVNSQGLRLTQMLKYLKKPEMVREISSKEEANQVLGSASALAAAQEKNSGEALPDGQINNWFEQRSMMSVAAMEHVSGAQALNHVVKDFNKEGFHARLEELNKVDPTRADALGDNTITVGNKALWATAMAAKDSIKYNPDTGKFEPQVKSSARGIAQRGQETLNKRANIAATEANNAIDLIVRLKGFDGTLGKLEDNELRDAIVATAMGRTNIPLVQEGKKLRDFNVDSSALTTQASRRSRSLNVAFEEQLGATADALRGFIRGANIERPETQEEQQVSSVEPSQVNTGNSANNTGAPLKKVERRRIVNVRPK